MSKTLLSSVAVGVAVATILTGCASGTQTAPSTAASSAEKPTEITLYSTMVKGTPLGTIQADVISKFEAETGIKVTVTEASGDGAMDAYEASVAAGTEADLVNFNAQGKVSTWVSKGAAVDATPYLEQWGLKDTVLPDAIADWTNSDGVTYGVPMIGNIWPMIWNTDALSKAGLSAPPTNEAELTGAVAAAKAAKVSLIAAGGKDWSGAKYAMMVFQAYSTADQTKELYRNGGYCASEPSMKGIEYFVRLRDAGVFQKDAAGYGYDQMNTAFFTGAAAGMHAGSWVFSEVPAKMQANTVASGMPLPADSTNKPLYYATYGSNGWLLSPNGVKKSEWIGKFVKMWYEQDVADKMAAAAQVLAFSPATAPSYDNPVLNSALGVRDSGQLAPLMDSLVPADKQQAFTDAASGAYTAGKTAQQVCAALDAAYE
ncbi:MAG: ABC transporter substrate-binding protein [Actinobacteria bacterium]|nr:ABC transporter substrate-binding protein [Actinomycetota bacterium]